MKSVSTFLVILKQALIGGGNSLFILGICLVFLSKINSQSPIKLENPSFEGEPASSTTPEGWIDCGYQVQSPVDIHPSNSFNVTTETLHGETYVGMVTRDDATTEAIGQKLSTPLLKGKTYYFSIYLARSPAYFSMSMYNGKEVEFIEPIVLKIWGDTNGCEQGELLGESVPIEHTSWKEYFFEFTPQTDHQYLMFESYYKPGLEHSYRGNILMDFCSSITENPIYDVQRKSLVNAGASLHSMDDFPNSKEWQEELRSIDSLLKINIIASKKEVFNNGTSPIHRIVRLRTFFDSCLGIGLNNTIRATEEPLMGLLEADIAFISDAFYYKFDKHLSIQLKRENNLKVTKRELMFSEDFNQNFEKYFHQDQVLKLLENYIIINRNAIKLELMELNSAKE